MNNQSSPLWSERLGLAPFLAFVFILPFPGTVAFRLLCLLLCTTLSILAWRGLNVPAWPCRWALVFWVAIAVGSLAYAVNFRYSLGEIKNEVGYTMLAFGAFFAYTRDVRRLRLVLASVAMSGAVIAAWAILLRSGTGYWDEAAGHGGSGSFGSLSVMVVPVLVALWFLWPRGRAAWFAAGLLTVAAAYFSYQRAVWPILAVEALISAWLLSRRHRFAPGRRMRLFAALAAAVLLASVGWLAQGAKVASYGTAANLDRDPRLVQWPAVAKRVAESPVSGAGFGREAMKLGHPDLLVSEYPQFWHAHNVFLNYGLEMGMAGLIALALLFAALAWRFFSIYENRSDTASIIGLTGMLLVVALVLRNLTNDFFVRDTALLFWALCGALFGAGLRAQSVEK